MPTACAGVAPARRPRDRPDRQTAPDHGRARTTEDAVGKDRRGDFCAMSRRISLGDVTTLADPTIMNLIQEGLGGELSRTRPRSMAPDPGAVVSLVEVESDAKVE